MEEKVEEGTILADKYRVERVIGRGGMGLVVAAEHMQLGQRVALKFLSVPKGDSSDAGERFLREARLAVRIRSEHVARVMDVATTPEGTPYIVMEYLEGEDLSLLCQRGPLAVPFAVDYLLHACEAVAEAHRLGIVHRDLKPANLFLTRRPNGSPLVKVLDFGISKVMAGNETSNASVTATGVLVGSPLYMSPEQIRDSRKVDLRADIWSLGAILHELLSGRPPYQAETLPGLLAKIVADPPERLSEALPGVDPGLEQVVWQCLQKELGKRYRSIGELAAALAPFASVTGAALARQIAAEPPGANDGGSAAPSASPRRSHASKAWGSTSWGASNASWIASRAGKVKASPRRWLLAALAAACGLAAAGWTAWGDPLPASGGQTLSATNKPAPDERPAPSPGVAPGNALVSPPTQGIAGDSPLSPALGSNTKASLGAKRIPGPNVALIEPPAAPALGERTGASTRGASAVSQAEPRAQQRRVPAGNDQRDTTQRGSAAKRPGTAARARPAAPKRRARAATPSRAGAKASARSPQRAKKAPSATSQQPAPHRASPSQPADDLDLFGDTK